MFRRAFVRFTAMTALGIALLPISAVAQQSAKDQLTGTWRNLQ